VWVRDSPVLRAILVVTAEQLKLSLGMPWDGVDPRYLTRGHEFVSFTSEGTGRPNLEARAVQLELFPEGTHYGS